MHSRLNHVALELAPENAHPFGARDIGYDVYLPLREDGLLDANAVPLGRCRVRCRNTGIVSHGTISVGADGKLVFSYHNGSSQDCGCQHLLEGAPLRAGQRFSICDNAGTPHPYEVVSIRET